MDFNTEDARRAQRRKKDRLTNNHAHDKGDRRGGSVRDGARGRGGFIEALAFLWQSQKEAARQPAKPWSSPEFSSSYSGL